jgi:hypothetical protein
MLSSSQAERSQQQSAQRLSAKGHKRPFFTFNACADRPSTGEKPDVQFFATMRYIGRPKVCLPSALLRAGLSVSLLCPACLSMGRRVNDGGVSLLPAVCTADFDPGCEPGRALLAAAQFSPAQPCRPLA